MVKHDENRGEFATWISVMHVEQCGKRVDCSGLRGDMEVGDQRKLVGTTLSVSSLEQEQRPDLGVAKEKSSGKCKNTLGKKEIILLTVENDHAQN